MITPLQSALRSMRRAAALGIGAAVLVTACTDLNLTNPNQPSTGSFWKTQTDAIQGVNSAYNGLLNNGTYGRWLAFALDIRSDEGRSPSPWADLSNFNKFTLGDYDFEVNRELFIHHYQAIFRANQVIDNVPGISMDATTRARVVGEAKFIRGLLYFNLVNLFGNVPLQVTTSNPQDQPATVTPAQTYVQIEKDLTDAAAVLPPAYAGADVGRATKGAALALLGKVQLQQQKFAEAAVSLAQVIAIPGYDLMPNYADNFTSMQENNKESVFEVQFSDRSQLASGVRGLNIAKMVGACGPGYCDGRPTRWFFDQFSIDKTTTGGIDPRRDVTIFSPTSTDVYGQTYVQRYGGDQELYFKKYGEYYLNVDQDWDAPINYRVIRYADVLLMQAEALNALGRTAEAYPLINRVRARAQLAPLPAGLSGQTMRDRILHERLLEFGLEGQRWLDLKRYNLLSSVVKADVGSPLCNPEPFLAGCDAEFSTFTTGKSELLPIPQTERNLNSKVAQNPGW
ncbi:MAG: RagB/SusD protein [Gemmatimonadetes bacterium]|nr:RagB/SusD protein [Gemmatimonadota bacterium]